MSEPGTVHPKKENSVFIYSPHADGKSDGSFFTYKTFVELHSKAALQHSSKQLKIRRLILKREKTAK